MNSMRAAMLWVYLLRGAALHDSPVDTLVAASRGTARVAEKVCFTSGEAALCLLLLPMANNRDLCGGRACWVMGRAVFSAAASVGRTSTRWHGIATPFPAEGMAGLGLPPSARGSLAGHGAARHPAVLGLHPRPRRGGDLGGQGCEGRVRGEALGRGLPEQGRVWLWPDQPAGQT
eukprot:COSAG01_NODE_235_length_20918_cov_41.045086_6_plen_175_part_00